MVRGQSNKGQNVEVEVEVEGDATEGVMRLSCLDEALPTGLVEWMRSVFPFAPDDVLLRAVVETARAQVTTFRNIGNAAVLAWESQNPETLQAAIDAAHEQTRNAGPR